MPCYDWGCPGCKATHSEILSYDDYDDWKPVPCPECGTTITRDDRIIGGNIKSMVRGVSKGNHNSNDWS